MQNFRVISIQLKRMSGIDCLYNFYKSLHSEIQVAEKEGYALFQEINDDKVFDKKVYISVWEMLLLTHFMLKMLPTLFPVEPALRHSTQVNFTFAKSSMTAPFPILVGKTIPALTILLRDR